MPDSVDPALAKQVQVAVASALAKHVTASEETTKLAVDRALRDATIERDIRDHESHLREINGSQAAMAEALGALKESLASLVASFKAQTLVQEALSKSVHEQQESGFARWQIWVAALMMIAAYGSIIAILVSHG